MSWIRIHNIIVQPDLKGGRNQQKNPKKYSWQNVASSWRCVVQPKQLQ